MCYAFDFLAPEKISAAKVRSVLEAFGRVASDGWSCWAFSNHDVMRHASRWAANEPDRLAYLKVVSALLMSLRGSVCLYQGEELGLGEAELAFEDLQDPYGIRFWPEFKGRDGCRTPMVWDDAKPNGGFSTARPWLPVAREHLPLAVNKQQGDPNSLLEHYRRFLAFRRRSSRRSSRATSSSSPSKATRSPSPAAKATSRSSAPSISAARRRPSISAAGKEGQPLSGHGLSGKAEGGTIRLQGYGAWFGRLA